MQQVRCVCATVPYEASRRRPSSLRPRARGRYTARLGNTRAGVLTDSCETLAEIKPPLRFGSVAQVWRHSINVSVWCPLMHLPVQLHVMQSLSIIIHFQLGNIKTCFGNAMRENLHV